LLLLGSFNFGGPRVLALASVADRAGSGLWRCIRAVQT